MNVSKLVRTTVMAAALMLAAGNAFAQGAARDLAAGNANVHAGGGNALAFAGNGGMPGTVADFLRTKGHGAATVASLVVSGEHANPNLGTTHLRMGQQVDGLTVYGTYVKAAFDGDGNLIHLIENLASAAGGVVAASASARDALDAALGEVHPGKPVNLAVSGGAGNTVRFGGDDFFYRDPTVTRVAVAMANGALHAGYLVETWTADDNLLHHTLVSGNGRVLGVQLRTNNDSYNIFPDHPGNSVQAVTAGPGAGNAESPVGWLFPVDQTTVKIIGNNAHAYLDTDADNAPDGGGSSVGDGNFLAAADLGQEPGTATNQEVAVQNLFYWNNVIHDRLYGHGFVESTGNFQENNFGNGGFGSDSVNAEAQDGSGTNNANFATPSDGSNPRMQMFVWTQSSPDRDGDVDSDIIWHEYGHGLTWRMIGNMSGPMSGAVGEGMGDVLAILANDDDRVGEYSFNDPVGIRSAPYTNYTRTYGDMTGNSVHFDGEIYAAAIWRLWELFQANALSVDTLMDYLVGGMNFTPAGPAMEDMRDGILVAANGSGNECLIWEAFADFGIGEGAVGSVKGGGPFGGGKLKVTESFALPAECLGPPNDAPVVTITAPTDGAVFLAGALVDFTGSATDTEDNDATLTGTIAWSSNIDGDLGTGGSVNDVPLSGGIHTITASVTDSGGKTDTDTISVTVGDVSGDPNAMYVWDIQMSKKGPHLNVTVTVRRDSDADGTAEAGDAAVVGAVPDVSLCLADNGCWFESSAVATDSNGQSKYKLFRAPSGEYTFTVNGITHGTYTYDPFANLDVGNPKVGNF